MEEAAIVKVTFHVQRQMVKQMKFGLYHPREQAPFRGNLGKLLIIEQKAYDSIMNAVGLLLRQAPRSLFHFVIEAREAIACLRNQAVERVSGSVGPLKRRRRQPS